MTAYADSLNVIQNPDVRNEKWFDLSYFKRAVVSTKLLFSHVLFFKVGVEKSLLTILFVLIHCTLSSLHPPPPSRSKFIVIVCNIVHTAK